MQTFALKPHKKDPCIIVLFTFECRNVHLRCSNSSIYVPLLGITFLAQKQKLLIMQGSFRWVQFCLILDECRYLILSCRTMWCIIQNSKVNRCRAFTRRRPERSEDKLLNKKWIFLYHKSEIITILDYPQLYLTAPDFLTDDLLCLIEENKDKPIRDMPIKPVIVSGICVRDCKNMIIDSSKIE